MLERGYPLTMIFEFNAGSEPYNKPISVDFPGWQVI